MEKINSIDELKFFTDNDDGADFFILLNENIKSSKFVHYDRISKSFYILNEVDGSEQELTEQQLNNKSITNIGDAISKGSFYKY